MPQQPFMQMRPPVSAGSHLSR